MQPWLERRPDAVGLVRAVDQVARPTERELVAAQRIVWPCRHHGGQDFAVFLVLGPYRRRRIPHWILLLGDDLGGAFGRGPAHLADADGVRVHHLLLAGLGRLEIVDPQRCDIDDDALTRRAGQHELRGHDDLASCPGQPGIDAWIGADNLFVADVEAPGDVRQRVLLRSDNDLHHADHVVVLRVDLEPVRVDTRQVHGLGWLDRCGRRWRRLDRGRKQGAAGQDQRAGDSEQGAGQFHPAIITSNWPGSLYQRASTAAGAGPAARCDRPPGAGNAFPAAPPPH